MKEKRLACSTEVVNEYDSVPTPRRTKKYNAGTVIGIIAIVIILAVAAYLAWNIVRTGSLSLWDSYKTAFDEEKDNAYQEQYQKYYNIAESEYHVANRASISVDNVRKTASLEVLKVSDIAYVIENTSDNSAGITSWLEVPGSGTYIVNLQAAEFIVDENHSYVFARIPYPEITNISIDYANVNKLLFKNDILNDSYSVGEDLARKMLQSADTIIREDFASNQYYYLSAQKAAKSSVTYLIRQLNPKVPNLTVEIEFV